MTTVAWNALAVLEHMALDTKRAEDAGSHH